MVVRLGNPRCPRLALELLLDPAPGLRVALSRLSGLAAFSAAW